MLATTNMILADLTFSRGDIHRLGLNIEIVCKNGYLVEVVTGKIKGKQIKVEQSHCINVSAWNSRGCTHKPIPCIGVAP